MHYHKNSTTNKVQREFIQSSNDKIVLLSDRFCVSEKTVRKWRSRSSSLDMSSRPHQIHYSLTPGEQELCVALRQMSWLPTDHLVDILHPLIPNAGHSNVSRTLRRFGVNKAPVPTKEEHRNFKAYEPGFIHVDLSYLPRIESTRKYLFVAIDRATRLVYVELLDSKKANTARGFIQRAIEFFPYKVRTVLTDNGSEFNYNAWRRRETRPKGIHPFVQEVERSGARCRATKIKHPWTNGLVERMNQTVKNATVYRHRYRNYREAELAIQNFVRIYNTHRKHSSLNRKTPFQVTMEWYEKKPEIFRYNPNQLNIFYSVSIQRSDT